MKEKVVWRRRGENNGYQTDGNEIVRVRPVTVEDGRWVLWVEQSLSPDYLYDPETDEYVFVFGEDGQVMTFYDCVLSSDENRLLDELLRELVA